MQMTKEEELQKKPDIILNNGDINKSYLLIMYDPDAVNGTYIHWLVSNIVLNDINKGTTLLDYKGPAPPPRTGKHRYIFELYLKGNDADITILNAKATTAMQVRMETVSDLAEELFILQTMGDDRSVTQVYINGIPSKNNQ